ncbi:MAG TPA: TetR/AcrR family transcriptional regulator [Polyangiales bacterium]
MKLASADGRSVRAEQKRSERREAILCAAERIFSQHGYHAASISDVIDAAGISRGTFYIYFDGKDALFLQLIERFIGFMTDALEVVDPNKPEPARRILENVQRVVDVAFEHPDLTRMVLRESRGLNAEVDEKLDRLYGFLHEMVEGALVNGTRSGLTRSVNEAVVATALIGAFKETFLRQLSPVNTETADRQTLALSLFEFGIRGLLVSG